MDKRGKSIFAPVLIWRKNHSKLCKQNFTGCLTSQKKSEIHCWVHKFQATGSVNNLKSKAENSRSCRKLMARCPDNVDMVRDSIEKNPKKSLQRRSQELCLSRILFDIVHQFLPLSSGLTSLKWYDCFLRIRWKMTWFNMNYHINELHLFWYIYI